MAKKLKDYFDADTAKLLANKVKNEYPEFDSQGFVSHISKEIIDKEFLARQDVYVDAIEKHLGDDYKNNIKIFTKILGAELTESEGMFKIGYWLWPIGRYVERHGVKELDTSIAFIYELTKRFTGEFAIRPLIEKNPKNVLQILLTWSKDDNVHVRRLASEGLRIRLPWAKKSYAALEELELFKSILTNLNRDNEKFVQKSVGNNLNDLMKENAELANEIVTEWQKNKPTKETLWIIKHGLRSLK